MKQKFATIVFFGSGPVAAKSLELLLGWCEVEAVVTKPQPPHHREIFPVIDVAERYELPLLFANNRAELDTITKDVKFTSRVGILIDYGIIVSQKVIDAFEFGIINSHFSILPELRGADPISFAILSGQKQTGVSLMMLVRAMDEGPLIAYGECDLEPNTTTPELTEDLIVLSNALLEKSLPRFLDGKLKPEPQSITGRTVSYTRKLSKEDGKIDWKKTAKVLEREIRAYTEWPKSRAVLGTIEVIITKAYAAPSQPSTAKPGDLDIVKQTGELGVATGSGTLWISTLIPAGKSEMTAKAFLAGYSQRLISTN